ncbi:MAG TPA: ribose 5-phosphate isomerase B [Candidatus Acidoferrales bacterium]|nr:ribose 5-phosphate isomerase B [Candidatus Acidoferrales bacterium]
MAADHAGFDLKALLLPWLRLEGHQVSDLGTKSDSPVDYPDFAEAAALAVVRGEVDRAIVICGSGVGATVAANKVPGIRACMCHDTYSAHQGVEHDDINILVLGARIIGIELAKELVRAWIQARFSNEERHVRRVGKIRKIEEKFGERMSLEKEMAK